MMFDEGVPVAVEVNGPQAEHRLGAFDRPAHAGSFQAILAQVTAGAFGHTAADGVAGRQVFVVAHVLAVVFVVANRGRYGPSSLDAQTVLVAEAPPAAA